MNLKFIFFLLLIGQVAKSQDIKSKADTNNYYDYFSTYKTNKNIQGEKLTTNWLRLDDAVPIIMEELKNGGYDWLYNYTLFKVDTGKYIVLAAYSRKSNFGFLFIEGHDMSPSKEHRINLTQKSELGVDYVACEETSSGEPNFVRISKLPSNIFVLNENCYWYQYTENANDDKFLITKDIAFDILRKDVRAYLEKAPKLTK